LHEIKQQQAWERERWSTTVLINIQLGKNDKVKPTDLMRFPWEIHQQKKQLNREEAKAILSKWQKEP
jgi:hypothetical protein|tara:strand:- start:440 stop:640 length:201 start_codon:yes stop_codon:yes gene_type:complete